MGFDVQITRFIVDAKIAGCDFSKTLTLGRQNIHVNKNELGDIFHEFNIQSASVDMCFESFPYVDNLLQQLGAEQPYSLDASDYEDATHIHDLNAPHPPHFTDKFSLIIDGGTLEHVFHLPNALSALSSILEVGGHFISVNGANNFNGHGFYQFSPELFFRVFSEENGYQVESMILCEVNSDGIWFEVTDPAIARKRVSLINNARTYVMMRARKVADVPMFDVTIPQQSDYRDGNWEDPTAAIQMEYLKRPLVQRLVEQYFPRPLRSITRRFKQATRNHFASPFLTRRDRGRF